MKGKASLWGGAVPSKLNKVRQDLINIQRWHPTQKSLSDFLGRDKTPDNTSWPIVKWYKKAVRNKEETKAIKYATDKMKSCRWFPCVNFESCFRLLHSLPNKLISAVPRTALLRWWLRGEADQQFWNHTIDTHTSNSLCPCGCGPGHYRPFGMNGHCYGVAHFSLPARIASPVWLLLVDTPTMGYLEQRIISPRFPQSAHQRIQQGRNHQTFLSQMRAVPEG